jgi:hypothetical protein
LTPSTGLREIALCSQRIEQGGERREFAADAGGREPAFLEVLTLGDDVVTGDGAQLGDAAEAGEGDELLDVDLVGAACFGVGEVGEPFDLGRNLGEVAELGRGERTLISHYAPENTTGFGSKTPGSENEPHSRDRSTIKGGDEGILRSLIPLR